MGRTIVLSGMLLILSGNCFAQFEKGRSEISLMGSLGSYTIKQSGSGVYAYSNSQSYYYLSFATTYDYYVLPEFSLEPEVSLNWVERSKAAVYLLGNLSYTHRLTNSPIALFGRVGYGVANGVMMPMFSGALFKEMNDMKVGIFNAGIGMKVMVSDNALVKLELNYRTHKWTNDYGFGYSNDETLSNLGIFSGFSFLF